MTATRAVLAVIFLAGALAVRAEDPPRIDPAAIGYTYDVGGFVPEYVPPAPGTYELPPIATVGDHPLLDPDGRATTLLDLKRERVAVVAFIYTTCVEAAGCPVSFAVLHELDRRLAADSSLAGRVTLLTISFDPERDTPERLARVRRLHAPASDWRFATTRTEAALTPLLADFDQPVAKLRFEDGRWTGLFRHVLKVFLVDGENRVRNVYSVGHLHAALVLNDVRTLLLETAAAKPAVRPRS